MKRTLTLLALVAISFSAAATNFGNEYNTYDQRTTNAPTANGGQGGAGGNGGNGGNATGGTGFGGAGGSVLGSGNSSNANTNLNSATAAQAQGQQMQQGQGQAQQATGGSATGGAGGAASSAATSGNSSAAGGNGAGNKTRVNVDASSVYEAAASTAYAPAVPTVLRSCRLYISLGGSSVGGAGSGGIPIGNDATCLADSQIELMSKVNKSFAGKFTEADFIIAACKVEGMADMAVCKK